MLFTLFQLITSGAVLEVVLLLIGYAALIFVMLPFHELAHAFVADKLGDNTARWHGRLRFNPLAHLDPWGTVMLLLFGFGYARPVPVNPRNFRNPKQGMALTALAGPVSNLLLAALSLGIFRVITLLPVSVLTLAIARFLLVYVFASVNLGLAVFNLLPVPPLDGSRILGLFLPDRVMYEMERYSRQITWIMMLLLFMGKLDAVLNFLRSLLGGALCALFGLPNLF